MKHDTDYLLSLVRNGIRSQNQKVTDAADSVKSMCVFCLMDYDIVVDDPMRPLVNILQDYLEQGERKYPVDMDEKYSYSSPAWRTVEGDGPSTA